MSLSCSLANRHQEHGYPFESVVFATPSTPLGYLLPVHAKSSPYEAIERLGSGRLGAKGDGEVIVEESTRNQALVGEWKGFAAGAGLTETRAGGDAVLGGGIPKTGVAATAKIAGHPGARDGAGKATTSE